MWETFNVTVNEVNVAPTLDPVGNQSGDELTVISFTATASDPDLPANGLAFSLEGSPPAGVAIDPVTGAFTWTPSEVQGPGVYPVTVRVTDDGTGLLWDEETFNVTVNEVNVAPTLDPVGNQSGDELTVISFTATASDPDLPANGLAFSLEGSPPAGVAIDPVTGAFTWTPSEVQGPGVYPVTVRVTDDGTGLLWDEETFNVTVNEVNVAPTLDPVGNQSGDELTVISFTATASDPDLPANGLAFSLEGSPPAGVAIDPVTGAFTWTPSEVQGPGVYPVTVRVTDDGTGLLWDEETFNVTVNEVNVAPVLAAIGNQIVNEGAMLSLIATATDADDPSNTLTFSLEGSPPAGLSLNPLTGLLDWTPSEVQGPGVYPVTVRVTDDGAGLHWDEETFSVTVGEVNVAPAANPIADQLANEGDTVSVGATALDSDLPANTLTWTQTAGPGATTPGGAYSWTTTEADGPGSYSVTLQVSDGSATDTVSFDITVAEVNVGPTADAIADRTQSEGTMVSIWATAVDPDLPANTLTWSRLAGPGSVTAGGIFSWLTNETHGPGSYSVTLQVSDGSATDTVSFDITVNESNRDPIADPIGDQFPFEGDTVSLTATAVDLDLPANTLTWTVTGGPGAVTPAGAYTWVTGEADGPGTYSVTLEVFDGTATDAVSFDIAVAEVNVGPTANAIANQFPDEGDTISLTATAIDPDLPANTLTWTLPAGPGAVTSGGVYTWVTGEPDGPGSYLVTLEVSDGAAMDSVSFNVTVGELNVAPVLAAIGSQIVNEGSMLSLITTAADADDPSNTLTFSLMGSPPAGMSLNTVTGLLEWKPTEAQGPGVYPVVVRVTDDGAPNLFDEETFNVTVNEANIAPVLAPIGNQTVDEMVFLSVATRATDADVPGNALTYSMQGSPPAGASIHPVTGVLTWTPSEALGAGVYPVTVRVTDNGAPNLFDEDTFNVVVDEVNVAPVLDPIVDVTVDELTAVTFAATVTDADLPANAHTFSLQGTPPPGASITSGGAFSWTPSEGQGPGTYPITVRVTDDGAPNLYGEAMFTVTVNEVNLAPALAPIGDRTVDEMVAFSFVASAMDGDLPVNGLTYTLVGAPADATIDPATGEFSWTPAEIDGPGTFTFDVVVTDSGTPTLTDSETITITVDDVNNPPIIDPIADQTIDELIPWSVTVTATDEDGPANSVTFSLPDPPAGMTIDPVTGRIAWTPSEEQGPGLHVFVVGAADDGVPSVSSAATIRVTVREVNVPPVAVDDTLTLTEDAIGSLNVVANDRDDDGNDLTVLEFTQPIGGTVGRDSATDLTFFPDRDWSGSTTFEYTVDDGDGGTATATVTVIVSPVNDPPSALDDSFLISGYGPRIVGVLGNDSDPDGDMFRLTDVTGDVHGTLAIEGRNLLYTPDVGWVGVDRFRYTIVDDHGAFSSATVEVEVLQIALDTATDLSNQVSTPLLAIEAPRAGDEPTLPGGLVAVRLLVDSFVQHLGALQMPFVPLLGALLWSLTLGRILGPLRAAGRLSWLGRSIGRHRWVLTKGDEIPAVGSPGTSGAVVHWFRGAGSEIKTTGRPVESHDTLWFPVETPDGPGWVNIHNIPYRSERNLVATPVPSV